VSASGKFYTAELGFMHKIILKNYINLPSSCVKETWVNFALRLESRLQDILDVHGNLPKSEQCPKSETLLLLSFSDESYSTHMV
jgi:hypothetical protein